MASLLAHAAAWVVKRRVRSALGDMRDPLHVRKVFSATPLPAPRGVLYRADTIGGVPGEWVEAKRAAPGRPVLFYLHGGGFVGCSPRTHRPITAAFALRGFSVFVPAYRLAPEHPFPAALDDAVACWRALRAAVSGPMHVAGDSAGGNLALGLMLRLRGAGQPLPEAAALLSPATDLTGAAQSLYTNDGRDAMFRSAGLAHLAQAYLQGADARYPFVSPLFADLAGLPPMIIHVGESEVLRDDSIRLAVRAREAGVRVRLQVWPVVPHVWQLIAHLPEARRSITIAARFLHDAGPGTGAAGRPSRAAAASSERAPGGQSAVPPATNAAPSAKSAPAPHHVDVLIIGTGFSGLAAAIKLKEAGFDDLLIVDRANEVGGTWRDNHYPGAACDIPSHLYSLSFEPRADWSRGYPRQPELLAYLKDVADRHGLRAQMRLGCTITAAAWDEARKRWKVTAGDGTTIDARVVVAGTGALHWPATPKLPGLDRFEGRSFHSADWDHDYDLAGKRVAVVGTGASAIQFVPEIADRVARLHVFQRTPPWVVPKLDSPIPPSRQRLYARFPVLRRLVRWLLFWLHEVRVLGFVRVSLLTRAAEKMARAHIAQQVKDPALRVRVTPAYTLGCKRVLISNDWYPTISRPSVELITEGVREVRARSIVAADGTERDVDAIIFGTGFEVTEGFTHLRVTGRGGLTLADAWRGGMRAYKGIAVPGFPNWFMLLGPNTGLGHNSVVMMIEGQVRHLVDCLRRMRRRGVDAVDVTPQAQARFGREIDARMARTVWQSGGCRSWYQDAQGRNTTLWPGSVPTYLALTRKATMGDFAPLR